VSVLLYAVTVVVLFRLAKAAYGTDAAMVSLAPLWFFPTLFAWSVSAMKESEMYSVGAIALVSTVGVVRARRWDIRAGCAIALVIACATLQGLRAGALEIVVGGLAIGLALRVATLRSWTVLLALAAVPLLAWGAARPGVVSRIDDQVRTAARRHMGYVWTPGESYRALDEHFYNYDDVEEIRLLAPNAIATMTHIEMARFLLRSVAAFFLVPEVWRQYGVRIRWLFPEQVAWYAALLLAIPGTVAAWRRDPLVTALLVGSVAAGVAIIAPNSGNIATLMRHRDIVSPYLFVLAAVGAVSVLRLAAQRGTAWR
jgi:hypothetical protein